MIIDDKTTKEQFVEYVVSLFRRHNALPTTEEFIGHDKNNKLVACPVGICAIAAGFKEGILRPESFLFDEFKWDKSFVYGLSRGFYDKEHAQLLKRPVPIFNPYGGDIDIEKFDKGWSYSRAIYDRLTAIGYKFGKVK